MAPKTQNKLFINGAYLYTLDKEMSEAQFVKAAGGIKKVLEGRKFPFVSVIFPENGGKPIFAGHMNGRTINLTITGRGYKKYQTMEWKK